MKQVIIGVIIGLIVGFGASNIYQNSKQSETNQSAVSLETERQEGAIAEAVLNENLVDAEEKASAIKLNANLNQQDVSEPKTIEEYQVVVASLRQAIMQQNESVQSLAAENKKLKDTIEQSEGGRRELQALTASDVNKAKANIESSIIEATPEYAEVLQSALEAYNSSGDVLPDSDALLRHYADDTDFAWADVAKAYIQNYFAAQAANNIQLVQLNCRKTYCEIYGYYSSGENLDNPRQAGSQIQAAFNAMEQAPGFDNLFVGLESASISIDSENSYMTFHNFIRSNRP